MLFVKKLDSRAKLPTCSHPGEDLAYDLYALEDAILLKGRATKVSTGIAAQHTGILRPYDMAAVGLLIRDRSSMAAKGVMISAGVIDAGYTGEINVLMTNTGSELPVVGVRAGDKIAQMIPIPVLTTEGVKEVTELTFGERGANGWGSTGR